MSEGEEPGTTPPEEEHKPPTLRDLLKGTEFKVSGIQALSTKVSADIANAYKPPVIPKIVTQVQETAERQREWREENARQMEQVYAATTERRRREDEWRDDLLEQQILTVEALNGLSAKQDVAETGNKWILRLTAIGVAVAVLSLVVASVALLAT